MTMTDPLGDMLTRIRNAQMRKKSKVSTPASRLRRNVLDVLQQEGYIRGYAQVDFDDSVLEFSWCQLYRLMEGSFGGLIATVAGIGAVISSAFGAYRAFISFLVVSIATFILRALVSLWFGMPECENGGGEGGGDGPAAPAGGGNANAGGGGDGFAQAG